MIRDLDVSRLSLGCAPLANLYTAVDPDVATATLDAALAGGITYFDTAPHYGAGLSETRVGAWLASVPRASVRLSTKVGRLLEPGAPRDNIFDAVPDLHSSFDFSADGIRRSLAASLERLGTDRVDIVYVHDPDDHMDQALAEAFPVLRQWRDEGIVGAIGAGMNFAGPLARIVREADVDCVLLAGQYTLLDQTGLHDLLPLCGERGVRVVAAAVFNSGILADPSDGATFFYSPAAPELIERARRMQAVCARYDVPLAAAAMQFPTGHPAVETVLVGMRSPEEIAANTVGFRVNIAADLWTELKQEGLLPQTTPTPS
ncbi:MAG TPA: aldo/keto reductase [Acidimicrobiales bacterium]|nr:aldo/keto reductase [Acidimicrobiales bacterium]